jgi:hypothetical protein
MRASRTRYAPGMTSEYLGWFAILVAVGVVAVAYLAVGPIPEIPTGEAPDETSSWPEIRPAVDAGGPPAAAPATAQRSPTSTTAPGSVEPGSTRDTP